MATQKVVSQQKIRTTVRALERRREFEAFSGMLIAELKDVLDTYSKLPPRTRPPLAQSTAGTMLMFLGPVSFRATWQLRRAPGECRADIESYIRSTMRFDDLLSPLGLSYVVNFPDAKCIMPYIELRVAS